MATPQLPERWLRGPVPGIPALLQPVAHALLQAQDEVTALVQHLPSNQLWVRPAGLASAGFHLQHLTGVLDRLTTYARAQALSANQLAALKNEGNDSEGNETAATLLSAFQAQVDKTLDELKAFDESTLAAPRAVGRAGLPSTVLGLLFHAAEHTMRHTGQLLVTVKVVQGGTV